nr:hypothetical protein [Anaerolineae bacterium]
NYVTRIRSVALAPAKTEHQKNLNDRTKKETAFQPSKHGFPFGNRYPGLPLPGKVPLADRLPTIYGLCGGMCFAAMDYMLAEKRIPAGHGIPPKGTHLHRYIFRRQIASFGQLGLDIPRYAHWMLLRDDTQRGTWVRTNQEFQRVRMQLDRGELVVLGIIYVSFRKTAIIWKNHQVLAYEYSTLSPTHYRIAIYDPNYPGNDQVVIEAKSVIVGKQAGSKEDRPPVYGLRCIQKIPKQPPREVRGFFQVNYKPKRPPVGL